SLFFFFASRRRHTRSKRDWSSDVCSSDLQPGKGGLRHFQDGPIRLGDEARPSAGRREPAVAVQARRALAGSGREGPLLRAERVEQGITEPGIIQVAPGG